MFYYLNGTSVRLYASPSSQMRVFYLDGTAMVLQEYVAANNTGTLFFSNWW